MENNFMKKFLEDTFEGETEQQDIKEPEQELPEFMEKLFTPQKIDPPLVRVKCQKLNVRVGPDINSKVILIVNKSDTLAKVNDLDTGWSNVHINKGGHSQDRTQAVVEGYCLTKFIEEI